MKPWYTEVEQCPQRKLLQLLLHTQVVGVSALLLSAILSTRVKSGIAFTADHFVAIVLLCQQSQTGLNNTTTKSEHQMKRGFFLDVVVWESASIFQLLSGEDQSLLVWGNSFLVLNFGLDIVDRIAWLDLKGDGLTCQGFHEDLHLVDLPVLTKCETVIEMKCEQIGETVSVKSNALPT